MINPVKQGSEFYDRQYKITESNTAINASPRPVQFDFIVKCCSVKPY